jgi:tetratricopeptide (TPR) repeat protein
VHRATENRRRFPALTRAGLVALVLVAFPAAAAGSVEQSASQVEQVFKQIDNARNQIDLVEKGYTQRPETTEEMARLQRFSDAEIQYLLGDFGTASVLFYDLVASKEFQATPRFADALFYLADSLYQQKNDLGARVYLRQLLGLNGPRYKEALTRYVEIEARLNEFAGVEELIATARSRLGGQLPPELGYVYGKWLFRRQDLSLEQRVERATQAFLPISQTPGPFKLQADYFIGVGYVQLKQWDKAIEHFGRLGRLPVTSKKERAVVEMASLALGRVLFEVQRYDEAIDRYQEVSRESDQFPDALYEIAWCWVRKNELTRAKNATEVLLLVAEDSVLAPEARILQGTLLQKLQKYDEAIDTYRSVIDEYTPVYENINALLSQHKDPVEYFDDLLARNDQSLDVTKLLPPVALKWASNRREVSAAQEITGALESSKQGLKESTAIATRILKTLEERGLESFPVLQEGYIRADAIDTSLTRSEETLTRIEGDLLQRMLPGDAQQRLSQIQGRSSDLKRRIATLPTTAEEVKARREKSQAEIERLDKQAYRLLIDVQSGNAQVVAIRKFLEDTRGQRKTSAEDEKVFWDDVGNQQTLLDQYFADLEEFRLELLSEKSNANTGVSGEDALRAQYVSSLAEERQVYAAVRGSASSEVQKVLYRMDGLRSDAATVRERVARSKKILRDRTQAKAQRLREQVLAEQSLLEGYGQETNAVASDTRNLVGRIAFDSFKRIRQSFYDLVLKADVGVVDVSFQRKQDKTLAIQKLAQQKERELKQLDDEFKEVLKDVD